MVSLETERLTLRTCALDDFESYAAMWAEPEVMRFLAADGKPLSRFAAWQAFSAQVGHWQLRGFGLFTVRERSSGLAPGIQKGGRTSRSAGPSVRNTGDSVTQLKPRLRPYSMRSTNCTDPGSSASSPQRTRARFTSPRGWVNSFKARQSFPTFMRTRKF